MPKLLLFVLPLGLDTFAVATALGVAGLPKRERLRVSVVLSGFELVMPIVGLAIGRGLGPVVGNVADYLAAGFLLALGLSLLVAGDDDAEKLGALPAAHGLALIGAGLGVSLDELAMGFTIGLLHLSIWLAVVLIAVQAVAVAQLGLRLGSRLGEAAREWPERLAALALLGLGALVLTEKLAG